jgi:zinc transporter 9
VIHCAADGIALGAASASNAAQLEFLVFLAILLHKAPSAFGLATYLMHAGFSRRYIRQHLIVFSAAAPVSAIVMYLILAQTSLGSDATLQWTGMLLLFSAGSFLYVATMHILPEIYNDPAKHGALDQDSGNEKQLSNKQVLSIGE